jgi:hypothetical protein
MQSTSGAGTNRAHGKIYFTANNSRAADEPMQQDANKSHGGHHNSNNYTFQAPHCHAKKTFKLIVKMPFP